MSTHFSLLSYQQMTLISPKINIYNNPLQSEGWKTQKAPVVLQSANN